MTFKEADHDLLDAYLKHVLDAVACGTVEVDAARGNIAEAVALVANGDEFRNYMRSVLDGAPIE